MILGDERVGRWGDSHTQMQSQFGQFLSHFRQGCFSKIPYFQEFIFGQLNEVPNTMDIFSFQAITCSHGEP